MSVVSWYYCNLIDDAPWEDPVDIGVQPFQNASNHDQPQAPGIKHSGSLDQVVQGVASAGELDVAKSLYVLTAETSDSTDDTGEQAAEASKSDRAAVIEGVKVVSEEVVAAFDGTSKVEMVEIAAVEDNGETAKRIERMPSIPEEDAIEEELVEKLVEGGASPVVGADETTDPVAVSKSTAVPEGEFIAMKPVADDFESETQSEVSESAVIEAVERESIANEAIDSESEVGEVMTIDAAAAAKDAALTEAAASKFPPQNRATPFGFIPEQIRSNSYAISSVAAVVATAVMATLIARR